MNVRGRAVHSNFHKGVSDQIRGASTKLYLTHGAAKKG